MKRFFYTLLSCFIIPFVLIGVVLYVVLYVLQLLFRTINLKLEEGMRWIDKNITPHIN